MANKLRSEDLQRAFYAQMGAPRRGEMRALPENVGLLGSLADKIQDPAHPERGLLMGGMGDYLRDIDQDRKTGYGGLLAASLDTIPGVDDLMAKGLLGVGAIGAVKKAGAKSGLLSGTGGGVMQISDALREKGVSNFLSEKDDVVTVSKIIVPEESRGKGIGTAAMQEIMDYADSTGKRVALTPSSDFGGNKKKLDNWYKKLGFKKNKTDFDVSESLVRYPSETQGLLSMDEAARMTRVAEMGHERGFYRGGKQAADGPWYARSEDAAREYGQAKTPNPDVREYSLKTDNAFSYGRTYTADDLVGVKKALEERGYDQTAKYLLDVPGDYGGAAPGEAIVQMVKQATGPLALGPVFKSAGFDLIDMGKELVVTHMDGTVRDAAKAVYDKAKKKSPDIFAGLLAPVAGLSVYTALGLNEDSL